MASFDAAETPEHPDTPLPEPAVTPRSVLEDIDLARKERFTAELRGETYRAMELPAEIAAEIEWMVLNSGARAVGKSALNNVRVGLHSRKNNGYREVESHTCEFVFALLLELDPNVLGYYTQVPCRYIERQEGRHVSNATLDFLVFYKDRVELVECKYESWIVAQVSRSNKEWVESVGGWTNQAYEAWAKKKQLSFRVFAQKIPFSCELRNLEAIYSQSDEEPTAQDLRIIRNARRAIKKTPRSIQALRAGVLGFKVRHALLMIARRDAFAMLKSSPLDNAEDFLLFEGRRQAEMADFSRFERVASSLSQPSVKEPILCASTTDCDRADLRLARLARIEAGDEPDTERMRQLARAIRDGVARGLSPFEVALTNFANCGNRNSRLTPGQALAITDVVNERWLTGQLTKICDLWFALEAKCVKRGEPTPSETTLSNHLSELDPARIALRRSGMRAYHAARPRSDASKRSQSPLGYGYLLIIDSSDFDRRCATNLLTLFPAEKPRFYLGLDGATGYPMAHSFIFGPARTDGLALLIREYVHRNGFLPRVIQVDRGPENTSEWLIEFCKHEGISLRHPPTGGSQFNGAAENAIGRVNAQLAHRGPGSTEPDMAGRKTDGKFKSRKTALQTFRQMHEEFKEFVYSDLPDTPAADGGTPREKRDELLLEMGHLGKPTQLDDAFLIKTSILVKLKGKATSKSGVRTGEGYFTSDDLQLALRAAEVERARRDCADPTVLYVKAGREWFKAYHSGVLSAAYASIDRKLFDLMYGPAIKKEARYTRVAVGRRRFSRFELAREAREATKHVAPAVTSPRGGDQESLKKEIEVQADQPGEREPINWDEIETC